jgi:hypothetical protein
VSGKTDSVRACDIDGKYERGNSTTRKTVRLPLELCEDLEALVEEDDYENVSQAMRQACRLLVEAEGRVFDE